MKKYLLVTLSLLVCVLAMAEPISSKKALEIATSYLAKSGAPRRAAAQMSVQPFQTDRQGNPLMYAVNNGGDGFVIVSGDDRMRQVLGYSNSGTLDIADMPENMRYWLQCLATDMQLLIDAGYQPQVVESRRAAAAVKTEVIPMLSCLWGQNAPYNNLCPDDDNGRTLTGCVATAIAQVLYYHKKERHAEIPSKPLQDTEAYTGNCGVPVPALKAENYAIDWNQLVKEYSETSTDAQKQNIAKLMLFCGAAVYMDYNSSVSLASSIEIAPALIKYFGFSPKTRIVERSSYTEQQWADLMYNELKSGRPVLYGGSGTEGGHQFVLDGYDGNEMFHFNWGWDGRYDGFVALSVLNSGEKFPVGARESTAEFASDQSAVINAEYGGTGTPSYRLSYYSSRIEGNEIYFGLINNTGVINSFEVCLAYKNRKTGETGYFDADTQKDTWNNLKKGYYGTHRLTFPTFYPDFANKDLIVYPVSRVVGTTEWLKASDEVFEYGIVSYDAEGNRTELSLYPKEKLNTTISVEGNKYAGSTQKIKAAVTNTGDEQQLSIYFWIKTDPNYFDNTEEKDRKYEAFAGITALKNATHVEVIPFTPATAGTYYIWVTKDRTGKVLLVKEQVAISASPHTVNGLAFSVFEPKGLQTTTIQSTGEIVQEVYALSITPKTFRLVNASDKDITGADVTFNLWKKEGGNWTEKQGSSLSGKVTLTPGQKINVNGWPFVEGIGEYRLELVCDGTVTDTRYINTYESYTTVDATGRQTPVKYTSGTITAPADAAALIIENIISNNVSVTPNDNPNTLYYLGEGMTATGLDGKNVINYNLAATIALQDGYDFCVPYEFTAQNISYKRSFEAGCTTLMVPFEVTTIPEGLTAYEFASEDGNEVTFNMLEKLSAFEGSLVKVDAAKEYTFTAANQKLFNNYTDAAAALNFKFIGISSKPDYAKAYLLSADGTKFELSDNPKYQSFRGCFVPTYGATYLPATLTIKGIPTGIKTIKASDAKTDGVYYNLSGQRVGADYKGIVIHNGKKMLRK